MNKQQLKIIVELSKGKSLIEIGEALEITQPTVTFHMRKLEEELGLSLYRKEKRNLVLTEAGRELIPYANQILKLMLEAKKKMIAVQNRQQPKLRISASHTPANYFLPPYIEKFKEENPQLEINIAVNKARKSIQLLKDNEIDLAVVSLQNFAVEGLNIHPLIEDKLLLAYSPDHELAGEDEITVDKLQQMTFLLHEEGTTSRVVTNDWAAKNNVAMSKRKEFTSIEAIKEAVKRGSGIGILPEKSIQQELEGGAIKAVPLPAYEYRRCICLAYRNEELLSPQVNSFIWFAIENMK